MLAPILTLFFQWLENKGVRIVNVVAVNFITDKEKKAWDAAQVVSLDTAYVASLTKEQKSAKSKDFRGKFKKFVTFGFIKPKPK